jgi:tetratricopeptide (TPR) repeat protein
MPTELTDEQVRNLSQSGSQFLDGRLKLQSGQLESAEMLLKDALRTRALALGNDDQGLACIADELGLCYMAKGRYEDAEQQFKAALTILEKNFYPGHARHYPVLEHLGNCLIGRQEYAEAEPILKRALEISEKTVSGEHRAIYEVIWKLTIVYQKLEKYSDAEALLAKGMKQLETPLGPIDEFRYQLAEISAALGKDKEAETAYKQAIEGLHKRRDYKRLADCLDSFAGFLQKAGQPSQSELASKRARLIRQTYGKFDQDIFPATLLRA